MPSSHRAAAAAGVALALGVGLLTAIAPPAGAMTSALPPGPQPLCGSSRNPSSTQNTNYGACVVVVNRTRGFAGPDRPSEAAGLAFTTSNRVSGVSSGRREGWALESATSAQQAELEAGNGWSAYQCHVLWPNLNGCTVTTTVAFKAPVPIASIAFSAGTATVTTSVAHGFRAGQEVTIAGATAGGNNGPFRIVGTPQPTRFTVTNARGVAQAGAAGTVVRGSAGDRKLQAAVMARDAGSLVVSGQVRYRASAVSVCDEVRSTYVRCRKGKSDGAQRWTRFNYSLTTETAVIEVTNRLPSRLQAQSPIWTNAIEDGRAESRNARLIAASERGIGVDGFWGGLLAINRNDSRFTVEYLAVDAPGLDDEYNGSRITVTLRFRGDRLEMDNACVAVPARANAPRPHCKVQGSSAGGITRLHVTVKR